MNLGSEFWIVIPDLESQTTNCSLPKYLLDRALRLNWQLPIILKITNPETDKYTICAVDHFLESDERKIHIPPMILKYLNLTELAEVSIINESLDLIPPRGKTIYLEPQSSKFYDIEDPQFTLENCLKRSHYLAQDYLIPVTVGTDRVLVKIKQMTDEFNREAKYINIHNLDLNVEFLPLPENLQTPALPDIKPKLKPKVKLRASYLTQPSGTTMSEPDEPAQRLGPSVIPPAYNSSVPWTAFCGWGRRLSDGEYVLRQQ